MGCPFWSERVREDFQLERSRPGDLPPVGDDSWSNDENSDGEVPIADQEEVTPDVDRDDSAVANGIDSRIGDNRWVRSSIRANRKPRSRSPIREEMNSAGKFQTPPASRKQSSGTAERGRSERRDSGEDDSPELKQDKSGPADQCLER